MQEYRWAKGTDLSDLLDCNVSTDASDGRPLCRSNGLALVLGTASNIPGGPDSVSPLCLCKFDNEHKGVYTCDNCDVIAVR